MAGEEGSQQGKVKVKVTEKGTGGNTQVKLLKREISIHKNLPSHPPPPCFLPFPPPPSLSCLSTFLFLSNLLPLPSYPSLTCFLPFSPPLLFFLLPSYPTSEFFLYSFLYSFTSSPHFSPFHSSRLPFSISFFSSLLTFPSPPLSCHLL